MKWRHWFRRKKTADELIAETDRLLMELERIGQVNPASQAVAQRKVLTKLCRECAWSKKIGYIDACVCPSQPNYDDYAGSERWHSYGTIRQFDCHGKWWEPK